MKKNLSGDKHKRDSAEVMVIGISSRALFDLRESHELFAANFLAPLAGSHGHGGKT